ncbi:hypothetical protein J6590_008819 [Homalodisca vitripennis]|nr:hypothetical protein J6590_008819 [Homalodisca vitripennis]
MQLRDGWGMYIATNCIRYGKSQTQWPVDYRRERATRWSRGLWRRGRQINDSTTKSPSHSHNRGDFSMSTHPHGSSCRVLIDSGNRMANRPGNRFIRVRPVTFPPSGLPHVSIHPPPHRGKD